jgi:hypothetical protein
VSLKSCFAGGAAAALVLSAPAAAAFADNGNSHGQSATHANHGRSKTHFTANGKVTEVSDTGFTMHVKGGSRDLHGTDVTITVTDATKMRRNGDRAAVADLQVGDRVNVHGARGDDSTFTARHVNAHGPATDDSTGSDTTGGDTTGSDTTGDDTGTTDPTGTDTGA